MKPREKTTRRMPAEWEEQHLVWLTWPHGATDWADCLYQISHTYVEMAREIVKHEQLLVVCQHEADVRFLLERAISPEWHQRISYFQCPTDDTWARDHGLITVSEQGRLRFLDFRFNGWGDKFPAENDNAINQHLYLNSPLSDRGEVEPHTDFVLEGGSIESDGEGTIFTTSQCLLAPNRNQPLSQDDIDLRLRAWLGAERIVWLNHGNLIGDDTDGHIDTIVRPAPNNTLLYVSCDDPTDAQYSDFRLLEEEIRTLKTLGGKPYRLLRLPMPKPVCHNNERLPATYANYLVLNGAVLLPTYGQSETDSEAADVLRQAFPNRDIVPIDATTIVRQHGSIHCCTMQMY